LGAIFEDISKMNKFIIILLLLFPTLIYAKEINIHNILSINLPVKTIHSHFMTDAIAEEYIEGREIYASVIGSRRLEVLPLREMIFRNFPEGKPRFATFEAKWDSEFRKKWGITNTFAHPMDKAPERKISRVARAAFRALGLSGYARLDLRLTENNDVYVIEVNPNPNLSNDDDFAYAAQRVNISYMQLIIKIVNWGLREVRW
jgi:D-alanine-D-alanine ligase